MKIETTTTCKPDKNDLIRIDGCLNQLTQMNISTGEAENYILAIKEAIEELVQKAFDKGQESNRTIDIDLVGSGKFSKEQIRALMTDISRLNELKPDDTLE